MAHLVVMSVCTSFTCEQSCKCDVYLGEVGGGGLWDLHGGALSGDGHGACRATEWTEAKTGTRMNLFTGGAAASGVAVKLSGIDA